MTNTVISSEKAGLFGMAMALAGVLFLFLLSALYTVTEGQKALVLRLGELLQSPSAATTETTTAAAIPASRVKIISPGLHLRLPLIDHILRFDVRLQTFDVKSSRILTKEQKYVLVDYYVKWRIDNLSLYYRRTGGSTLRAERLLKQKINNALRAAFGERSITDVVSGERSTIMALLKEAADTSADNLGITVVDVRIKRIDLPKEVVVSVFKRMRAEREQVATQYRSDGKAQAEVLRANADAQVTITLAKARLDAAKIEAEGHATAARIYANAYNKAPEFYNFYRSLQAYRRIFHPNQDVLVLQPQGSQFFRYLKKNSVPVSSSKHPS